MTPTSQADAALTHWLGEIELWANGASNEAWEWESGKVGDDLDLATAELFDSTPVLALIARLTNGGD